MALAGRRLNETYPAEARSAEAVASVVDMYLSMLSLRG